MKKRLAQLLPVFFLASCAPLLPDGVICETSTTVGTTEEMHRAVEQATRGHCVVARAGTYKGGFAINEGVILVAEREATVTVEYSKEEDSAIRFGAIDGQLVGINVDAQSELGIWIDAAGIRLTDVVVSNAAGGAVGIRCEDAGCFREQGQIDLDRVRLRDSEYGLWISGGQVTLNECHISGNSSQKIAGGAGIYALNKTRCRLQRTTIEDNVMGLVADGEDTKIELEQSVVQGNSNRGLWVQNLRGSQSDPGLRISGSDSLIDQNGLVGVGIYDSQGIVLADTKVTNTQLRDVVIDVSTTASIGDGIGIFGGSSDVTIKGANMENNDRAQILVDNGGTAIQLDDGNTVAAGGGLYKIVIQNTSEQVTVHDADLSQAEELPTVEQMVSLPQVE